MNAISFITCKRLDMFYETVNALVANCKDLHLIDAVFHYDDSSPLIERLTMRELLQRSFPDKLIRSTYLDSADFETDRHSMEIMNRWLKDMNDFHIRYALHMEDDWRFDAPFSIREAIRIMSENPTVAYVGYHQPIRPQIIAYRQTHGLPPTRWMGNYWEWLYDTARDVCANLFVDTLEMEEHALRYNDDTYWSYFINWPHYSFRPGVHDIARLCTLGNFDYETGAVELEFAKKFANHFVAYYHAGKLCTHLGEYSSAFDLNKSNR